MFPTLLSDDEIVRFNRVPGLTAMATIPSFEYRRCSSLACSALPCADQILLRTAWIDRAQTSLLILYMKTVDPNHKVLWRCGPSCITSNAAIGVGKSKVARLDRLMMRARPALSAGIRSWVK